VRCVAFGLAFLICADACSFIFFCAHTAHPLRLYIAQNTAQVLLCIGDSSPIDREFSGVLLLVDVLFYASALPMIYVVSCLLSTPAYGFASLFLAQVVLVMVVNVLQLTCMFNPGSSVCQAPQAFLWIPIVSMSTAQLNLITQTDLRRQASQLASSSTSLCTTQEQCCQELSCASVLQWSDPGVGKQVRVSVLHT
jgi:hypothetical protein